MKKQLEEIMISVEQGEDALREMNYLLRRVNELHGIVTKQHQYVINKVKNLNPYITDSIFKKRKFQKDTKRIFLME